MTERADQLYQKLAHLSDTRVGVSDERLDAIPTEGRLKIVSVMRTVIADIEGLEVDATQPGLETRIRAELAFWKASMEALNGGLN